MLNDLPAARGAALALLAAILFGLSTPLVQRFGAGVEPFATAALLYVGAAAAGLLSRRSANREARLSRSDLPRLLTVAAFGAVIGPVALAWGLQRTSATNGSLMLTLEAVFTAALAWRLYRETIDIRVGVALLLLTVGGGLLIVDQGRIGVGSAWGLIAVVLCTAAWGIDNALSRALAERDPGQVVLAKATLGAFATGALALAASERVPSATDAAALVAVGATGYGFSLRLYLLAQRAFGATRAGSVFAFAPFIGAAFAIALGERSPGAFAVAGAALMLAGVILHVTESHAHEHEHTSLEHEHAHQHDDGHHDHHHDIPPDGVHSHPHRHGYRRHTHPHVPDAHHRHRH